MAPRESFTPGIPGLCCPLCLSKNFTVIAKREDEHGRTRTLYRCEDCKSFFGDPREPGLPDEKGEKGRP